MKSGLLKKPVMRSSFRIKAGGLHFTLRRYARWLFGGIRFAAKSENVLSFECCSHKTPLLRKLKDVDMYMQQNKIINLKIAVAKVNCVMLRPGETFSYWRLVGKPTKAKGYLNGMVLQNGKVTAGIGGGLCQLSNLIYWLTLHTPLTVVERHRHGYDVFPDSNRKQPFGSGATCFYNYGDLMIENNTEQTFQLVVNVTENDLEGIWLTDKPSTLIYEVYEQNHVIQSEFWGGYTRHNVLCRRIFDLNNNQLADEYLVENHAILTYKPFLPEHTE
ncbi:MAG: VanW family protein [Oscillospiraceae bacterium]|nr:VanW family protein [Oscillospiraceae bacterium]